MQEKIEKDIVQVLAESPPTNTISACRYVAAEIATLFERNVIWEEDEVTVKGGWLWFSDVKRRELRKAVEKLSDGQRVRVVVEEIDDKKSAD